MVCRLRVPKGIEKIRDANQDAANRVERKVSASRARLGRTKLDENAIKLSEK